MATVQANSLEAAELRTHSLVVGKPKRRAGRTCCCWILRCALSKKENVVNNTNKLLNGLDQVGWQMLLLGGRYESFTPTQALQGVAQIHHAGCACAYAVNANYYDVLLDAYRQARTRR